MQQWHQAIDYRWKVLTSLFVGLFSVPVFAQTGPQGVTLQGRILNPNDQPIESSQVVITIEIHSPGSEDCLLFKEAHTLNMTGSEGIFSLVLGAGSQSGGGFESTSTLAQVFNNGVGILPGLTCATGDSYTPAASHKRKLKFSFDDGDSGPQAVTQSFDIQAVPMPSTLIASKVR